MTDTHAASDPVEEAFRLLGSATAAGLVAGVLVGGVGGRIVMRASAIAADSDGVLTENGNRVGDVTVGGTIELIIFGGGLLGLLGGVLLFAARPWLPGKLALRAAAFAVALPLMVATTVIRSENPDFLLLDPPELNIAMFGGLFAAFGAAIVLAQAGIERILPKPQARTGGGGSAYALAALLVPIAIATLLLFTNEEARLVSVILAGLGAATILHLLDRVEDAPLPRLRAAATPLGYASLAAACLAGAISAAREIEAIL